MTKPPIPGGNNPARGLNSTETGGVGKGVYARFPAGTPKYNTNNNTASVRSQARMYVELPDRATYHALRDAMPLRARSLLDVLCPQSGISSVGFFDFLVSNVSTSFQEKYQVSEVLSDGHVAFFFGQRASQWQFSGTLLNTRQDNWFSAFHVLYQDVLRGSQLAKYGLELKLVYDDREVTGSLVSMSDVINSSDETQTPFNFTLLVKSVRIRTPVRASNVGAGMRPISPQTTEAAARKRVTTLNSKMGNQNTVDVQAQLKLIEDTFRPGTDAQTVANHFNLGTTTITVNPNPSSISLGTSTLTVNPNPSSISLGTSTISVGINALYKGVTNNGPRPKPAKSTIR